MMGTGLITETHPCVAAAVGWWGEWLERGDVAAFKAALAQALALKLNEPEGRATILCDYDPKDILLEAVRAAGVQCPGVWFSAVGILPEKTTMWCSRTRVQVCAGRRGHMRTIFELDPQADPDPAAVEVARCAAAWWGARLQMVNGRGFEDRLRAALLRRLANDDSASLGLDSEDRDILIDAAKISGAGVASSPLRLELSMYVAPGFIEVHENGVERELLFVDGVWWERLAGVLAIVSDASAKRSAAKFTRRESRADSWWQPDTAT